MICGLTVLTLCYLPIIEALDRGLYVVGYMALSHLAPPISAVFISGIFIRSSNGPGALAGFGVGSLIGLIRFVLSILFQHQCDSDCEEQTQVRTRHHSIIQIDWCLHTAAAFDVVQCLCVLEFQLLCHSSHDLHDGNDFDRQQLLPTDRSLYPEKCASLYPSAVVHFL